MGGRDARGWSRFEARIWVVRPTRHIEYCGNGRVWMYLPVSFQTWLANKVTDQRVLLNLVVHLQSRKRRQGMRYFQQDSSGVTPLHPARHAQPHQTSAVCSVLTSCSSKPCVAEEGRKAVKVSWMIVLQ
jgi:hypothetical protein